MNLSLTIVLTLALFISATSLFAGTATPLSVAQGSSEGSYYDDHEWNNSTDAYSDIWNYTDTFLVWGCNATSGNNYTYFLIEETITEDYTVNQTWEDVWIYIYQDHSASSSAPSDLSNVSSDPSLFTGDQSYYEIWCWYSVYNYSSISTHNYTIWEACTTPAGDLVEDIDGNPVLTREIINTGAEFLVDPDSPDQFIVDFLGDFTDSPFNYYELTFGYQVGQWTAAWVESVNASSSIFSSVWTQYGGLVAFNDTNHNHAMDIAIQPSVVSEGEWEFDTAASEWTYSIYYVNCSDFVVNMPSVQANDSFYFEASLLNITAAIVNYNETLGDAMDSGTAKLAYIPYDTVTFNLTWNANRTDLKVGHEIGNFYNYSVARSLSYNMGATLPMAELDGLSLGLNYFGTSYSEASSEHYSYTANNGTTSSVETDETWDLSIGGSGVISINAAGNYTCQSTSHSQYLAVIPSGAYSAATNYYAESETDIVTGSVNYSESWFNIVICLPEWSGYAILMDPVFSTFARLQVPGPPAVDGYSVLMLVGIAGFVTTLLAKRSVSRRK
jgi:hypothetical protein